jgi:hypothetical protein
MCIMNSWKTELRTRAHAVESELETLRSESRRFDQERALLQQTLTTTKENTTKEQWEMHRRYAVICISPSFVCLCVGLVGTCMPWFHRESVVVVVVVVEGSGAKHTQCARG